MIDSMKCLFVATSCLYRDVEMFLEMNIKCIVDWMVDGWRTDDVKHTVTQAEARDRSELLERSRNACDA